MQAPSESDVVAPPLNGRVVRLHFCCRAELPIGSSLRVTGSSLWAPGASAHDPTEAHQVAKEAEAQSFPVQDTGEDGVHDTTWGLDTDASALPSTTSMYTSSVELVTTPETYPLWTTRRPVVVVLHKNQSQIQHHYYRYLVVTPGAATEAGFSGGMSMAEDDDDYDNGNSMLEEPATGMVSTSDENVGTTAVMSWEDPYSSLNLTSSVSGVSLASGKSFATNNNVPMTKATLMNLPFRTLDINVRTANPILGADEGDIRIDTWNNKDDVSFRPYLIREAMNAEIRRKSTQKKSGYDTQDTAMEEDGGSGSQTPPAIPSKSRIFFVCFHLPVVVVQNATTGEWRAEWSESLLAKSETSKILQSCEAQWVGTVSPRPPIASEADRDAVIKVLADMNCTPIFLDDNVRQAHYFGFCKQVLWPAFHNIDLLDLSTSGLVGLTSTEGSDWDQSRLDEWWTAYQQVNHRFAECLRETVRKHDIVWVHDYHLSVLPSILHQQEVSKYGMRITRKVFFLHIPFPTSQIFRELECGEAILEGMLHADVLGFHAFDHARHFLNAAKRILGLNYESLVGGLIGVNFRGKTVLVTMSNVSIEPDMVEAALQLPSVHSGTDQIRQKHGQRTILGSIDIGQQLSGVALKLLAYERLLQDYPNWQSRVVMLQRVLLPGSRKADEIFTSRELRALVKRIQAKFGPEVIDYEEIGGSSLPLDKRLAIWKSSDVFINTPIREGLNLWPMEYIFARKDPAIPGVVITSEFSAVSSILNGALRVNPYDIQMTITTIDKALTMDIQERAGRRYRDIDFVSNSPSEKWFQNVMRDLRDAVTSRPVASHSEANSAMSTPLGTPVPTRQKELIDSTAAFLTSERNVAFSHLRLKDLKSAYDSTNRRVIILDFNGTIVVKEPPGKYLKREILGTSGNKPPPEVLDALAELCSDMRNTVYVVSGDSSENVLNALGHIPGLGLAVSNGARFSPPLAPGDTQRRWKTFDLGVDWDAVKKVALPVLSKYTARSNGSFVKLTSFSIGWSYYSCDPEWGSLQASHLVLELESELRAYDVRFVTLKGIVEIVPRKLNKGLIVKKLLRDNVVRHPEGTNFILCMGDDVSDEKMFTSVFSHLAEMGEEQTVVDSPPVMNEDGSIDAPIGLNGAAVIRNPMYAYAVTVGRKPSHASSYLNDSPEVANALVLLANGSVPAGGVVIWGRENATHLFT